MDGGCQRIQKASIGVGSKINPDLSPGSNRPGNLDIEFDFAVGAEGITGGRVCGAIHGNWSDLGIGELQIAEEGVEVLRPISPAQFKNSNGLPGAVQAGWKIISLSDLRRIVSPLRDARPRLSHQLLADAEVRLDLRTIVQTENTFNHSGELDWNR